MYYIHEIRFETNVNTGGIFYAKGVVSFMGSLDEVRDGIVQVQELCRMGINYTDSVFEAQDELEEGGVAPPTTVDGNGTSDRGVCIPNEEVSAQIRETYRSLEDSVKQLRTMLDGRLDGLASDLNSLLLLTEDIDRTLEVANIFLAILIAISLVFLVLVLAMLVGVYFAYRGMSNRITTCVRRAVIWPMFAVMLTLSWIFATLFLSASLAGADFCIDPDAYVQAFLNEHSEEFQSIFFGFVLYYVSVSLFLFCFQQRC